MKKIKIFFVLSIFLTLILSSSIIFMAKSESLSENISNQLDLLDLTELEEFFNNFKFNNEIEFNTLVDNLLKGKYENSSEKFGEYFVNFFLSNFKEKMPIFFSVIAIVVLCSIIQSSKSKYISNSIAELVSIVCLFTIVLLFIKEIILLWSNTKIAIENISKLTTIMSPIIISLMIASGGNVSASVYKPSVMLLSNGIINIFTYVLLPLVNIVTIFGVISCFSKLIKLDKFSDFFSSIIKWIIGLSCSVFGIFLTLQGITSATFDGISIKAVKYTISNSIPLIGGFLKDGFDLMIAGSVLIKNAIGISCVFALLFIILSPLVNMLSFSIMLKLTSAIVQPMAESNVVNFFSVLSKGISYLIVCLLAVGFMFFLTVLLMIFSANAFI